MPAGASWSVAFRLLKVCWFWSTWTRLQIISHNTSDKKCCSLSRQKTGILQLPQNGVNLQLGVIQIDWNVGQRLHAWWRGLMCSWVDCVGWDSSGWNLSWWSDEGNSEKKDLLPFQLSSDQPGAAGASTTWRGHVHTSRELIPGRKLFLGWTDRSTSKEARTPLSFRIMYSVNGLNTHPMDFFILLGKRKRGFTWAQADARDIVMLLADCFSNLRVGPF